MGGGSRWSVAKCIGDPVSRRSRRDMGAFQAAGRWVPGVAGGGALGKAWARAARKQASRIRSAVRSGLCGRTEVRDVEGLSVPTNREAVAIESHTRSLRRKCGQSGRGARTLMAWWPRRGPAAF